MRGYSRAMPMTLALGFSLGGLCLSLASAEDKSTTFVVSGGDEAEEKSLADFAKELQEISSEEMAKRIEQKHASDPLKAASEMDWVARGYVDMGDMNRSAPAVYQEYRSKADFMYRRAMALRETQGAEHPDVAISLGHLAMFYYLDRQVESEQFVERLLKISDKSFPLSPELAWTLHNLANWHRDAGKYAEAEGLFLRELDIREQAYRKKTEINADTDMMIVMESLIKLYKDQGRYNDAVGIYARWEEIVGLPFRTKDPYGAGLDPMELAELYSQLGKNDKAEPLYLQSLAETEKRFVRNQRVVADSLTKVAAFYASQGKDKAAAPMYQRALSIWESELAKKEKEHGPNHRDVADPLLKLAEIYRGQGKEAQAVPLYERALRLRLGEVDWNSVNTINLRAMPPLLELARIYKSQGKEVEAQHLYDKLVELLKWNARANEAMYGRESPNTAIRALEDNAARLREVGRVQEAEAMEARVEAVRAKLDQVLKEGQSTNTR